MCEFEDGNSVFTVENTNMANQGRLKISYTRDFLLSFSSMDICKRPPKGFDSSFLSDCQYSEEVRNALVWHRAYGTSSIQSSKHAENGLQAATWVESSSRTFNDKAAWQSSGPSSHGRWENHPGSGEESGDQESEKGSVSQDFSRQYRSQSRQLAQSSERDGLLGSGGFPRPSVHAGGPLRGQRNGGHLSHSTERYQQPWMNKPAYQTRRDATDLCNDKTFGSSECPSQDKADEERRRRASFEIMRKEQQKTLQEKLKQAPNKQNTDILRSGISGDQISQQNDSGVDGHAGLHQTDHLKSSLPHASAARPLVPPGFASTILDKNAAKAPIPSLESEHDRFMPVECLKSTNASMFTNDTVVDQIKDKFLAADPKVCNEHLKFQDGGASSTNGIERHVATCLGPTNDSITDLAPSKSIEKKIGVSLENSNSILEKLFGCAMKANTGSAAASELSVAKPNEEPWDSTDQSSRLAHWFTEEEAKSSIDQHLSKAEGLLSLFVNAEKGMSQGQTNAATTFPLETGNVQESLQVPLIRSACSTAPDVDKLDVASGVLTCEDLEQFILAEANASHGVAPPTKESVTPYDLGTTHQKTNVDDRASQHLLSLLQKGPFLSETASPTEGNDSVSVPIAFPVAGEGSRLPQKTLTLETLFGTAFMQELQSAEAPVSGQGLSRKGAVKYADDVSDVNLVSTGFHGFGPAKNSHDISGMLYRGLTDTNNTSWVEDVHGSKERSTGPNVAGVFGFEAEHVDDTTNIHLPEEDSLISIGNPPPTKAAKVALPRSASKEDNFFLPVMPDDIINKFAVLSNMPKGDGNVMSHANHQPLQEVLRGPFDMSGPEIRYPQHLFGSRPVHQLSTNPLRPTYSQLEQDPNRNLERFMGFGPNNPGHDLRHPLAPNVLPHSFHHGAGMPARLDHPQHSAIQHMIRNNFRGPHPLAPLPTDVLLPPPHLQGMGVFNNPMAALLPDLHSFQGPSFHQRPPHFNPMEMPFPGGRPEGLERLIEMELRANANKKPPFVHNPGPLGPELDMGYRYR